MRVTGETMIFKNEKGYSTSISSKNKDGKWESMYLSVTIPKNIDVENKTKINVTDGFLTFWKDKNGMAHPKIVVMECEISNDDLPF